MSADVDVIIAVHRPDRPLYRAVKSVLTGNTIDIHIIIVTHRLDAHDLDDYQELVTLNCVTFLRCDDPFPSAAAPRNLALEHCSARWVSTLDSDDWHQPGALTHWVHTGDALDADAVVPRHLRSNGSVVRTPVQRIFHRRLYAVQDRLAYRVGHLGLTKRSVIEELSLRYREGLTIGEDLFFSYPLWFSQKRIIADVGPAYVVNVDGDHTSVGKPISTELASLHLFLQSEQWSFLSPAAQLSVALKFLRGQVISAASNRSAEALNHRSDREALRGCIYEIFSAVPGAHNFLSCADAAIIFALVDLTIPGEEIVKYCQQRTHTFARPLGLIPVDWWRIFHREAPLRFAIASALHR